MAVIFVIVTIFFVGVAIVAAKENGEFSSKRDDGKGKWGVYFENGTLETYDSYRKANDRYESCETALHLYKLK